MIGKAARVGKLPGITRAVSTKIQVTVAMFSPNNFMVMSGEISLIILPYQSLGLHLFPISCTVDLEFSCSEPI